MEYSHNSAFLPVIAIPSPSRTFTSITTRGRFQRRHVLSASIAPKDEASSQRQAAHPWVRAACATAAASLLVFSGANLGEHAVGPVPPAQARGGGAAFLAASGEVIKDPEALLRWSLPIQNATVRSVQTELEAGVNELRGLKWSSVESRVKRVTYLLNNQTDKILAAVPDGRVDEASKILAHVGESLDKLEAAVGEKSTDKFSKVGRAMLREIGTVEELMIAEFPYKVPDEFANLPQLRGRATVEMVVRKGGDEQFDINGVFFKEGKLTLVMDGYSAPISAGNFVDLVAKGFYNGNTVARSDGFIVQAGKPTKGDGYVEKDGGNMRTIPLEVFAKGDKMPIYGLTLEDDGRGSNQTVLPFTSYGTLAMARNEVEADSASSQFFWFLFEPDLTPAGRNLMDGNWAVMGYTTEGGNFLREFQKGDEIVSAKVVDGMQNLVPGS